MSIVCVYSLSGTDAVGVMTGRTHNLVLQILALLGKTLIAENTISTIAPVAKTVGEITFRSVIECTLIVNKQQ
ncbi:MAG: hypothetical protein JSW59_00635 [Phycisphaerales bacterium]|nr:MAG: hypothetical protein JSW59_00635 [Phycisphaerales bacterium]